MPIANVCLQHKSTFGVHYRRGSPGQLGLRVAGSQNVTKFHACNTPGSSDINYTRPACISTLLSGDRYIFYRLVLLFFENKAANGVTVTPDELCYYLYQLFMELHRVHSLPVRADGLFDVPRLTTVISRNHSDLARRAFSQFSVAAPLN